MYDSLNQDGESVTKLVPVGDLVLFLFVTDCCL